jgi:hypothetical protein
VWLACTTLIYATAQLVGGFGTAKCPPVTQRATTDDGQRGAASKMDAMRSSTEPNVNQSFIQEIKHLMRSH